MACALTTSFTTRTAGDPQDGLVEPNFKQVDLVHVVEAIAKEGRVNVVVSPEVKGTVTWYEAEPVSWRAALSYVLRTNEWKMSRDGETILVAATSGDLARLEAAFVSSHFCEIRMAPNGASLNESMALPAYARGSR